MRRTLRFVFAVLSLTTLSVFIIFEAVYRYQISHIANLPKVPAVSTELPSLVTTGLLGYFGERDPKSKLFGYFDYIKPFELKPVMPWDAYNDLRTCEECNSTKMKPFVAQTILATNHELICDFDIVCMKEAALNIWISRNWTKKQVVYFAAEHLFFQGKFGLQEISQLIYRKDLNSLDLGKSQIFWLQYRLGIGNERALSRWI